MPLELAHLILHEAWSNLEGGEKRGARWQFFRSASLVSRAWQNTMTSVALRYIVIACSTDFKVYRKLIIDEFGDDPDARPHERVHPSARAYFKHSELHITLADYTTIIRNFSYNTDYARIPDYVSACRRVTVVCTALPTDDGTMQPFHPVFVCLRQYSTTRAVTLAWEYTHIKDYPLPSDRVRGVTDLELVHYPRCRCHIFAPRPGHSSECFSFHLLSLFPDLRRLHIRTPYILKGLSHHWNLEVLTIEAPPVHYLPKLGYYSTLTPWNVPAAISAGFMTRVDPGSLKRVTLDTPSGDKPAMLRKIVVNTGPGKPLGWEKALSACESHDIELEFCHIYEDPLPVPQR